jgi:alanyl-tRNA synthetase
VEVTRELVEEGGLTLDLMGFEQAMEEQRARARKAQKGGDSYQDAVTRFARATNHATEFKGYEREDLFTVLESIHTLEDGRVLLALRESPFYAEMGGQIADTGLVESDTGKAEVLDVQQHGEVQVITARLLEGDARRRQSSESLAVVQLSTRYRGSSPGHASVALRFAGHAG